MRLADPKTLVEYTATLDCIHCGLCLRTCPTFQLTGNEASSPRGRIYLMRGVAEGEIAGDDATYHDELEFCLGCRNCESVCPAGVRFGEMMEVARDRAADSVKRPWLEALARWIGFELVLPNRTLMRWSMDLLGFAQRSGLLRRVAPLFGARKDALLAFPKVPSKAERELLPIRTPARGEEHGEVTVLEGCVMPEMFGRVNRATVETLSAIGFATRTCGSHACCGALHAHNGELDGARALAKNTIVAFEGLTSSDGVPLPVIVNSAGCGAHMKEYPRLLAAEPEWRARAQAFSQRVFDFSEFVAAHAPADWRPRVDPGTFGRVTYDDPCHLCHGQQIRKQPRELLKRVQGLEQVELPHSEQCCGSAGIYSMLRPSDSNAVFEPKLADLAETRADTLVTANPGCHMQWDMGLDRAVLDVRVVHIAEVLAEASRPR
ncbi:MAG: 4Fe-4S dicluster domain-containing protein [Planctomycetes bacterium]|nr:4Fe-4S dicluster domain-containing protein [Planctomycetota bacterium]